MKSKKNTNNLSPLGVVLRTIKYFYKEAFSYKPAYFIFVTLQVIISAITPFINIILPKYIIDELLGERNLVYIGIITAIICIGNFVFSSILHYLNETILKYGDSFEIYFETNLSYRIMNMDFEHTEDPAALEQLEKAKTGMSWYSGGVEGLTKSFTNILSGTITLLGIVFLLASNSPVLLVAGVLGVIISSIINSKVNRINAIYFQKLVGLNRAFSYILWGLSDFKYGKDIRLYGATDMMIHKVDTYNNDTSLAWKGQSLDVLKLNEGSVFVDTVTLSFAYLYLGFQMIRRTITVGDFNMLTRSSSVFQSSLKSIIFNIQEIHKKSTFMNEYVTFMSYPDRLEKGKLPIPKDVAYTFTFQNVGFKYPRSESYVLRNINLTLSDEESLSVVGLNGAGKTTLVKLLCRLYDVTEGEILLNGINIKEYDYEEYLDLFSVVFQDFKLFAFSIHENILLKSDSSSSETEELLGLTAECGLEEKISSLKDGLDTIIYKGFDEDGVDISGGEAQKIAIARALQKNAPVVILDEPTAALDPVAEYEIYNHFDNLVGGKIALYISHRLSSCKFCDKIAVFSGDTIAEYGTHDQLVIKEGGVYKEMFNAQATYYT